jgi:hypothetical protein
MVKERDLQDCHSQCVTWRYPHLNHAALRDLFRRHPLKKSISSTERLEGSSELTKLFVRQCPRPEKRPFALFAIDCTPNERLFAKTLEDRTMVYAPNKVSGQIPVTIGHQYSLLAFLPERETMSSTWIIPLSMQRVKSEEKGPEVGLEQLKKILDLPELKETFCVEVSDCAYSSQKCIKSAEQSPNLVHIARLRGNRVFYHPIRYSQNEEELSNMVKRGRPKKYGEGFRLNSPPKIEEVKIFYRKTKSGRIIRVMCERWKDLLIKGECNCAPLDVVRVTVINEQEQSVYPRPLWLVVVGEKRMTLTLEQIFDSYSQRYDIEHFFRFGKTKMLLDKFQTPNVVQEENWWWLCTGAYVMLYKSRFLANDLPYPWEKKKPPSAVEQSPSRVQRDYKRIITEIGAMTSFPKPRGKSLGRKKGQIIMKRPIQMVIKKCKQKRKRQKVA